MGLVWKRFSLHSIRQKSVTWPPHTKREAVIVSLILCPEREEIGFANRQSLLQFYFACPYSCITYLVSSCLFQMTTLSIKSVHDCASILSAIAFVHALFVCFLSFYNRLLANQPASYLPPFSMYASLKGLHFKTQISLNHFLFQPLLTAYKVKS